MNFSVDIWIIHAVVSLKTGVPLESLVGRLVVPKTLSLRTVLPLFHALSSLSYKLLFNIDSPKMTITIASNLYWTVFEGHRDEK